MIKQNMEASNSIDDNKMIEFLAYLELAIGRGNFEAIFLLSEDGGIVHKMEKPTPSIDIEPLRSILKSALEYSPQLSELILNYQEHTAVIQPVKAVSFKGGSARIPDVAYIIAILPPTRTFRKVVNELIRNLSAPFIVRVKSEAKKKAAEQKKLIEEQKRKEFAEKVLKDLDEI